MTRSGLLPPIGGAARSMACIGLTALCVGVVLWPGLDGFWGRDDFMQLAFSRLLGSPWPLFWHDHFPPAPGAVFRPLGFAWMWACTWLFGTDYRLHAIAGTTLHICVCVALFGVLRAAAVPRAAALAGCLAFGLHPAVTGTVLWWSARFDVLATLFILLALRAAFAYRESATATALVACLCALLAAMLCKEIGLVVALPIVVLWLRGALGEPIRRRRAAVGIVGVFATVAVFLAWRAFVLGTASSAIVGGLPLASALGKGILDWLQQAGGYLSFWPRLGGPARTLVLSALAVIAGCGVAAMSRRRPARMSDAIRSGELAVVGVALLLVPALLQAPVAALNAAALRAGASAVEVAMQSRLYYLGICGTVIALSGVLAALVERGAATERRLLLATVFVLLAASGITSWNEARAFATRATSIAAVARQANAAVAALDLPRERCHVAFVGVDPPPEWNVFVSMDSIVKALAADLPHVAHCYFHADYVTYFHLMAAPAEAADALPFEPLALDGTVVPWRRVGDLVIAYLGARQAADVAPIADITLLRYHDGRFDEVRDASERAALLSRVR